MLFVLTNNIRDVKLKSLFMIGFVLFVKSEKPFSKDSLYLTLNKNHSILKVKKGCRQIDSQILLDDALHAYFIF